MTKDEPVHDESSRLSQAEALESLILANANSNSTMVSLVEKIREDSELRNQKVDLLEKSVRQMRWLIVLVAVIIAGQFTIAGINAYNISQARKNAGRTAEIARGVEQTNSVLLDCLNSTGECGRANAEEQKKFLDDVKRFNLAGFYCLRLNPATEDEAGEKLLACMKRLYPDGPELQFP